MKQFQTKTVSFEIMEAEDRVVKGYGSVFGNLDSDNDTIKKGSFKRTIRSWGPEGKNRIKLVSQHNMSRPVAAITKMVEDDKGLYFEAKFGTHTDGEDHYRMVKEGILTEFSVGFVPIEGEENEKGGTDFSEIKLYEISLVTVASNDEAVVTDVKTDELLEEVLEKATEGKSILTDKEKAFEVEALLLKMAAAFNIKTTQLADNAPGSVVEKEATELETLAKAFELT